MGIDCLGLARPGATGVLEVTNQFFLLSIYADNRMSSGHEKPFHPLDVAELTIPVRMWRTSEPFAVGLQGEALILQQSSDGHMPDWKTRFTQRLAQLAETAPYTLDRKSVV